MCGVSFIVFNQACVNYFLFLKYDIKYVKYINDNISFHSLSLGNRYGGVTEVTKIHTKEKPAMLLREILASFKNIDLSEYFIKHLFWLNSVIQSPNGPAIKRIYIFFKILH